MSLLLQDILNERTLLVSTVAMIFAGFLTLLGTGIITAPYGRHLKNSGWGPLIPAKIAWFLMESPNLWVPYLVYSVSEQNKLAGFSNRAFLLCFLTHYANRSIIYPLSMKDGNPVPLSVMSLAFTFCLWNSFNQSLSLIVITDYDSSWHSNLQFVVGVGLFYLGLYLNMKADNALVKLRERKEDSEEPKEGQPRKYFIPRGGMFEWVSCPNYSAEILEWIGFAIACNSLSAAAFAWYTFSNLAPRAIAHHNWYKTKFEDYPKNRKALVPFVL